MMALVCLALLPVISRKTYTPLAIDGENSSYNGSVSGNHQQTNGDLLIAPWIVFCLAILAFDLSSGVCTCFSHCFAVLRAEENGISFGRLIVWSTLGSAACAMMLSFLSQFTSLPRLLPGILFGVALLAIDIITVSCWTKQEDSRPLTIPTNAAKHLDPSDHLPVSDSARVYMDRGINEHDGFMRRGTEGPNEISVKYKHQPTGPNAKTEHEMPPDPVSISTILSGENTNVIDHNLSYDFQVKTNRSPLDSPGDRYDQEQQPPQPPAVKLPQQQPPPPLLKVNNQEPPPKATSFKVQLLFFFLILKRRKSLIRYLILFTLSGFFMALHWNYFFLYLEQIYRDEFVLISALSMTGQGLLGELPFFILSRKFIDWFGRSNTLSISFITMGIRFLLYRFLLPNVSMYYIFIADTFQGPNYGLFYVVMTEIGLDYSFCDDKTIDKLAEMRKVDKNDQRQVVSLRLSLRSTIPSMAFACYEGLGTSLGSLAGGWCVTHYGFNTLWLVMSVGALTVGLMNLIIEIYFCKRNSSRQGILKK